MSDRVRKDEISNLLEKVISAEGLGSADRKRLEALKRLFFQKDELNLADVIRRLFPEKDERKGAEAFKAFKSRVNKVAKTFNLQLASPKDNRPPEEKTLWIEAERRRIEEEAISERLRERQPELLSSHIYQLQHYIHSKHRATTLKEAFTIPPERIEAFAQTILRDSWYRYPPDLRRFLSSLTVKFEAINQIDPPSTYGFEVLGIGPEAQRFEDLLKWIEKNGVNRAHLSAVILNIALEMVEAFLSILRTHTTYRPVFDINLDTSLLSPKNSELLYSVLERYDIQKFVFEIMEDTKREHLLQIKNLIADFPNIKLCLDDVKELDPVVRAELNERAEFVKLDYKHCQDLLNIRGDSPKGVLRELLRHTDPDKPIVFEGIDRPEYEKFLINNIDQRFYIQGHNVHPESPFSDYLLCLDAVDHPHPAGYCIKKEFEVHLPEPKGFVQKVLERLNREVGLSKVEQKDGYAIVEIEGLGFRIGIGDGLPEDTQLRYIIEETPKKSERERVGDRPIRCSLEEFIRQTEVLRRISEKAPRYILDEERFPAKGWIPPQDAYQRLKDWVGSDGIPYCFILGDYGVGKTFLCRMFSWYLLKERELPLPLYIDMALLRIREDALLRDIIGEYIGEYLRLPPEYAETLLDMVADGQVIPIFDGADEHTAHLKYKDATSLFFQLRRCAQDRGKVVIACRTHYFKDREHEKRIAKGEERLARHLIEGSTLVLHIKEFDSDQVREYLSRRFREEEAEEAYNLIQTIHDLPDISKRPVLLHLITEVLPKLKELKGKVSAASLYELIVKEWSSRDQNKHYIQEEIKLRFMEEVAVRLWKKKALSVDMEELDEWLCEYLAEKNYPTDPEIADIDIRTATFLSRDDKGEYRFIHRSFEEFFLARRIKEGLRKREHNVLEIPRLSAETVRFAIDLLGAPPRYVEEIVERDYSTLQKENGMLFISIWNREKRDKMVPSRFELRGVDLSGMDLSGMNLSSADLKYADLSHTVLKGAILRGADLYRANLASADLSYANLSSAKLNEVNLAGASLRSADLSSADLSGADLTSAGFVGADLTGAEMREAKPNNARFLYARLSEDAREYFQKNGASLPASEKELKIELLPPAYPIWCVAFSRDNTTIASATGENIVLWDAKTRRHIATLTGHTSYVTSVCFSKDNKLLASGSLDKTIRIWDVENNKLLSVLERHRDSVLSVCFSSDNKLLASGSKDTTIRIWDVENNKLLSVLEGHTDWVRSVCFSPNNKLLASGSGDTIRIWDVENKELLSVLEGHRYSVNSVCFSQDNKLLASGSFDNTIRIWDVENRKLLSVLKGHINSVDSVCFSPNNKLLASGSADKTIRIWDVENKRLISVLEGHTDSVHSVCFSSNNKLLASGSLDKTIRIWDVENKRLLSVLKGHTGWVNSICFSSDNKLLASGSRDSTIRIWDVERRKLLSILKGHINSVDSVCFSHNNKLLASGSLDSTIRIWDVERRKLLSVEGHRDWVYSVCFSPNNKLLASGSFDNTIRIWDVENKKLISVLEGHTDSVHSVCFSPNNKLLASGSLDKTIRIWDVENKRLISVLSGHTGWVNSVCFSPDNKLLASGSADDTIRIWDVENKRLISVLEGHTHWVNSVCFSPNNKLLASGSWDNTIRIWDVENRKLLSVLKGHTDWVNSVCFSPNNKLLASGSRDNTIRIWDLEEKKPISLILLSEDGYAWIEDENVCSKEDSAIELLTFSHRLAAYSYYEFANMRQDKS
jgi:WD40 repeat protein